MAGSRSGFDPTSIVQQPAGLLIVRRFLEGKLQFLQILSIVLGKRVAGAGAPSRRGR
jgi:hypothetical protein